MRIFLNSELQSEFVYDDDYVLKEGQSNFIVTSKWPEKKQVNERLKYLYVDDGNVADVEVFDANGELIRRIKYSYDEQGDVNKIKFILPDVDTWDFFFDYGSEHLKWSTFDRDTIEFLRIKEIDPLSHKIGWSDPNSFHYFWKRDSAGNISDLFYSDTRLILSYDTRREPIT